MAKITELTPRKANRAGERVKAFKDADEDFVNANILIDKDGNIIDSDKSANIGELILYELRTLNDNITQIMGSL